ncbi:MAG: phosphoglycerate dehydrogenase [Chitinophagales bacterium]|jgi:D-3-phosphoglycerate dehydrogenase|nr:phosphoglycerate dehydrogenase [Chitinophagales bacterium]
MKENLAFPKNKIKVLLLEGVDSSAVTAFEAEGFQVQYLKTALSEEELLEQINDIHILGIRSKTQITQAVLEKASKLLCIGAFCIGTNQIDLQYAMQRGIAVFNAPYSNTRSVVELAIGQMICLMRHVFQKSREMDQTIWNKSTQTSREIRGKKLGIIGYGHIGSQLSVLAESLGMQVLYYDLVDKMPLGNAKQVAELGDLFAQCDVISVHVDGRAENKEFINQEVLSRIEAPIILLNLARGHVLDVEAVNQAIAQGKIIGFSVDVFPEEPAQNGTGFQNPFVPMTNSVATPHIGGSTLEAQASIGQFIPAKLIQFINQGNTQGAVNFPEINVPMLRDAHRILHIHQNIPGLLTQINKTLSDLQINIEGQYLKTHESIGYVVTDIGLNHPDNIYDLMREIPNTIRVRPLF